MTEPTNEDEFDRLAREIGIPACPAILSQFSAEMHQPEPDMRRLSQLIASDIALSGALLKLVNSPFYGMRSKAASPHQALSIIGLRAATNLITGLILRHTFPASGSALMQRFWDKASLTAEAATVIARAIRGIDADEAHTFTLFRDCGIPVMITRFAGYGHIIEQLDHVPGAQVIVRVQMDYQYSHARVGYALARGWLLPEPFCRAILYHHDLEKVIAGRREVEPVNRKLVAFGLLMEQIISLRSGGGLCPDWPSGEAFVLETLKLSPDDIVGLIQAAE